MCRGRDRLDGRRGEPKAQRLISCSSVVHLVPTAKYGCARPSAARSVHHCSVHLDDATRRLDKPEQSSRRPDSSDATQTARTASGQSSRSSDMTGQSGHCPHTPRV